MNTELTPFNITDHIRQKVREVLIASIPDQKMDALIKAEFDRFFLSRSQYGHEINSDFANLVQDILKDSLKSRIQEWVDKNLPTEWVDGREKIVGEVVAKLAPIVQLALITEITNVTLLAFKEKMHQI